MPKERRNSKVTTKKDPKYVEFKEVRLLLPKNPFLYKLRRVYWLLQNYHRVLQADPTAINTKAYVDLLDLYIRLNEESIKKGLNTRQGRKDARARVDTSNVAQKVPVTDDETADSGEIPFSVGT